jgi:hypothetical protein
MRTIPSIEQLRQRPALLALEATYGRPAIVDALRAEAAAVRERAAGVTDEDDVIGTIERRTIQRLAIVMAPSLRRVINGTGVILHTNLGRAPLARRAAERVATLAAGYTNLEYDLAEGTRGKRDVHAEQLLRRLTGAEAAVVVNNNAAATLVVLASLATGREVVISRGELVEIGGGFRIPDVTCNPARYCARLARRIARERLTMRRQSAIARRFFCGYIRRISESKGLPNARPSPRSSGSAGVSVFRSSRISAAAISARRRQPPLPRTRLTRFAMNQGLRTVLTPVRTSSCSAATNCWAGPRQASLSGVRRSSDESARIR